jgi:hypothetical protein
MGLFHRKTGRPAMSAKTDPADTFGYISGIARISSQQQVLNPARHGAADLGVCYDAAIYRDLSFQMTFDSCNRINCYCRSHSISPPS